MKKLQNLVIVESPTKARKLRGYLGKEYLVTSSVGHVRDLPKSSLGVNEDTLEPEYAISPDKEEVVKKLQSESKKAAEIYLAMDPDREGEAIAWHLRFLLKDEKPDDTSFHRSVFHEITKDAVLKAIANPGRINRDLVDAQQARRVLDRLVGYKLSPVLWKKVRRGLSAGRVQSVALRLIVEKEREIEAFKADEYWEFDVLLNTKSASFKRHSKSLGLEGVEAPAWLKESAETQFTARLQTIDGKKYEPEKQSQIEPLADSLPRADYRVASIEKKKRQRHSLPPFTTSTLQQTAANRLGYTSKQTMRLAQQLYEEGLITYHRTDSMALSSQAIGMARAFVENQFGQKYLPEKPRVFKSNSKNAQEAHEAIRVTNAELQKDEIAGKSKKFTERHAKLYDLIWRRFMASQMTPAIYDQTQVEIEAKTKKQLVGLKTNGSILEFDGWTRLFPNREDRLLPELEEGQNLHFNDLFAAQKFTQPPARYNDASLVKELEKRGIGRPSTYASIISVIVDRGYVEREEKRFKPTAVGSTVSDFLLKHFKDVMDYDFTAEMEEDLDEIARGKKEWQKTLKKFYKDFKKQVEEVTEKANRAEIPVEKTGKKCPKCGKTENGEVVIRTGRYGKFLSCNRFPDCDYTDKLVEKVKGVKCPLCSEGSVIVKKTRWGKSFYGCSTYPTCDWASWKEPKRGEKVSKKQWAEMQKKRKERAEKRQKGQKAAGKSK